MSFVIMFLTLFGLILNAVTKACLVLTSVKNKNSQYCQPTVLNHRHLHFIPIYHACLLKPLYTQRSQHGRLRPQAPIHF